MIIINTGISFRLCYNYFGSSIGIGEDRGQIRDDEALDDKTKSCINRTIIRFYTLPANTFCITKCRIMNR